MTSENKLEKCKKTHLDFKAFLVLNDIKRNEVVQVLNINIKKLNEDSDFTLEEVTMICDKYNLSSDIFVKT